MSFCLFLGSKWHLSWAPLQVRWCFTKILLFPDQPHEYFLDTTWLIPYTLLGLCSMCKNYGRSCWDSMVLFPSFCFCRFVLVCLLGWRRNLSLAPSQARWCSRKDYNSLTSTPSFLPQGVGAVCVCGGVWLSCRTYNQAPRTKVCCLCTAGAVK